MAPQQQAETASTSTTTGSADETSNQEQQGQQQQATPETGGNGQQQEATVETRLPDDHPLVKAYRTQLEENRKLSNVKTELAEANAKVKKVAELETELASRPTQEALDTLQARYDRLEAFLQAAGGDISKALDSRSFTRDLFESDKDIATLVKDWNKAHPSTTSTALGAAAAQQQGSKPSQNDLLRAAIGS